MSIKSAGRSGADLHKEDILKAAVAEFGRVGYAAASTNEIVKQAGVSKGLLFHYFTNKETLYTACQLYVMEQYSKFMTKNIDLSSPDFFDRILNNLRIKMEFGSENKEFLAMINRAFHIEGEENPLPRTDAEAFVMQQMENKPSFFMEGLDMSLFREGVEPSKVMNYTRLALEASWVRFSQRHHNDMEAMVRDIDEYYRECEEIVMLLKFGAYG